MSLWNSGTRPRWRSRVPIERFPAPRGREPSGSVARRVSEGPSVARRANGRESSGLHTIPAGVSRENISRPAHSLWPGDPLYPEGVSHHSPGSRRRSAPWETRPREAQPFRQRREGFLGDPAHKAAHTFPAPSPPQTTWLSGWMFCGERVGVRGPHRSLKPPHPGPLPHNGVDFESGIECGGEGAEPRETPHENLHGVA